MATELLNEEISRTFPEGIGPDRSCALLEM
jgi:hypothetical protein